MQILGVSGMHAGICLLKRHASRPDARPSPAPPPPHVENEVVVAVALQQRQGVLWSGFKAAGGGRGLVSIWVPRLKFAALCIPPHAARQPLPFAIHRPRATLPAALPPTHTHIRTHNTHTHTRTHTPRTAPIEKSSNWMTALGQRDDTALTNCQGGGTGVRWLLRGRPCGSRNARRSRRTPTAPWTQTLDHPGPHHLKPNHPRSSLLRSRPLPHPGGRSRPCPPGACAAARGTGGRPAGAGCWCPGGLGF